MISPRGHLIYVASPYSSSNKAVEEARNTDVAVATGYLMNEYPTLSFFSPICHSHPISTIVHLPGDWNFWCHLDTTMLSRCDEIWVLCLDGWRESKGVTGELNIALEFGLPVKYITPIERGYKVVDNAPSYAGISD